MRHWIGDEAEYLDKPRRIRRRVSVWRPSDPMCLQLARGLAEIGELALREGFQRFDGEWRVLRFFEPCHQLPLAPVITLFSAENETRRLHVGGGHW